MRNDFVDTSKAINGLASMLGRAAKRAYQDGKARGEAEAARRRREIERREIVETHKEAYGSAGWVSFDALARAGLLGDAADFGSRLSARIPIGPLAVWDKRTKPEELPHPTAFAWWKADRPGHFLTVGGTRAGKEASQIVPTLLHYPGSCLVVDPKGDIYKSTAGWRHLKGSRIIRIAPFDEEGRTDAFNPLDYIDSEADARALAEVMIPRQQGSAEAKFFENEAVNFVTGVILFVTRNSSPHRRNIAEVRVNTKPRPRPLLTEFLEDMVHDEHSAVSNAGQMAMERARASSGSRDRLIELFRSLDAEMAVWDDEGLQRATSRSDVDLRTLKDDIVTVYLDVPFNRMNSHGAFLRAFFIQAANAMMARGGELDIPVLFLIDEFPSMGPMPSIVDNLSYMYGYGVRVWLFAQMLGQIQEVYPERWHQIVESASLKSFMNVRHPATETVSRELGNRTQVVESLGRSRNIGRSEADAGGGTISGGDSYNRGLQFAARPLLTPDEVEGWLSRKRQDNSDLGLLTLTIADDMRFCVNRPFWFLNGRLRDMVARGQAHLARTAPEALREVYRPG